MKLWKQTLITAAAFLGVSSAVLYTGCVQDSCTELNCKNGGSCADGYCRCPTGFEGAECENRIIDRFIGTYTGSTRCDESPAMLDTLDIFVVQEPLMIGLTRRADPGTVIQGFADGNRIIIADRQEGNEAWFANAVLDNERITVYIEHATDVAQNRKTVCNFIGAKPKAEIVYE